MRLLIVNNIPTPYRTFLFERLYRQGQRFGVDVRVAYQAAREARRAWRPEQFEARFPNFISRGLRPWRAAPKPLFTYTTLNADILEQIASGHFRWVMMAAFMSITNWIASVIPLCRTLRLLWSESNVYSTQRMNPAARLLKRALLSRYDMLVCPGQRAVEYVAGLNPCTRRLPVLWLPNLVDVAAFRQRVAELRLQRETIRRQLGLPRDELVLLGVGQMIDLKGYDELVEAAADVAGRFRIVLLGDGPRRSQWQQRVSRLGLQERVCLPGQADVETVLRYLAVADWFIHPAHFDDSPLVVIEAINAGLPLAVSEQTGNTPETVRPGVNGYTFAGGQVDEVRACLQRIVDTPPEQRAAFARASERISHERFEPDVVVSRFFRDLLRYTRLRSSAAPRG